MDPDKNAATIMIIDDDPENLRVLGTLLTQQGHTVRSIALFGGHPRPRAWRGTTEGEFFGELGGSNSLTVTWNSSRSDRLVRSASLRRTSISIESAPTWISLTVVPK